MPKCSWQACVAPLGGKLNACGSCRMAQYCCLEHQRLDWKQGGHKGMCKQLLADQKTQAIKAENDVFGPHSEKYLEDHPEVVGIRARGTRRATVMLRAESTADGQVVPPLLAFQELPRNLILREMLYSHRPESGPPSIMFPNGLEGARSFRITTSRDAPEQEHVAMLSDTFSLFERIGIKLEKDMKLRQYLPSGEIVSTFTEMDQY